MVALTLDSQEYFSANKCRCTPAPGQSELTRDRYWLCKQAEDLKDSVREQQIVLIREPRFGTCADRDRGGDFRVEEGVRPILATQRRSREWFWRVHSSWVNPRGEHVKVWNKLQVRGRLRGQLV